MGPALRRPAQPRSTCPVTWPRAWSWSVFEGRGTQMPDLGREGRSVKAPREPCARSKDTSCCRRRTLRPALSFQTPRGHGEGPAGHAQEPLGKCHQLTLQGGPSLTAARSGPGLGDGDTVREPALRPSSGAAGTRTAPNGGHILTRRTRDYVTSRGTRDFANVSWL